LGVLIFPGFLLAGIILFAFTKPEGDAERGSKAYDLSLREAYIVIVTLTPLSTLEVLYRLCPDTNGADQAGIIFIGLVISFIVLYLEIGSNRMW